MKCLINKYSSAIFCILLAINFVLSTTALIKINSSSKVYTIGINRLTDSFTKGLSNTNLSALQQSAQVINFSKGLEAALHEFKGSGKVLLMEEAVLAGGIDITAQMVEKIKKDMDKNA